MGFFRKKTDPISERERALNQQIAALEAEIERLSAQQNSHSEADNKTVSPQPRLRSTTLPHGHAGSVLAAPQKPESQAPREPVFEDVNPFHSQLETGPVTAHDELGVRNDPPSVWDRIKSSFRRPPTSNPKLVNYLAAGSIQGLRPLRYEKRVARNRFLLFAIALALVLWGLLAVLLKRTG
ncbi:MAG: hypothetical protein L0Y58_25485 [Verrucomicrobia subdivision 3 bacterium]|nr:hypothetical protein [Limisphaerales bacterium]